MMHPKHPMYMPFAWESAKARWREAWEFLQKGFLFRISPLPPTLLAFWGWCVSPPSPCSQACPHCLCGVCHECCGGGSACGLGAGVEAPPWHAGRVAGSLLPLDLASRYPCLGLWSLLWGHGARGVGAWGGWVLVSWHRFLCVCVCAWCVARAHTCFVLAGRGGSAARVACVRCVCVGVRGGVVCVLSFSVCVCSFCFCCCSSSLRLLHRGSLLRSSVCFSFSAFVGSFCGCGGGGVGRGGGCLGGVGWLGAWVVGRWFGVGWVWGGWVGVVGWGGWGLGLVVSGRCCGHARTCAVLRPFLLSLLALVRVLPPQNACSIRIVSTNPNAPSLVRSSSTMIDSQFLVYSWPSVCDPSMGPGKWMIFVLAGTCEVLLFCCFVG